MEDLRAAYSRWRRDGRGNIILEYMIYGFNGPYRFPSEDEIHRLADETLLRVKQVPKKIMINSDSVILFFKQKVFRTKKDRAARDRFFEKIISLSEKAS